MALSTSACPDKHNYLNYPYAYFVFHNFAHIDLEVTIVFYFSDRSMLGGKLKRHLVGYNINRLGQ